ncbi:MAG: VanW family protein [Clostridia bacterium]|nr:VanW family protein [Clostridia bacterium]
MGSYDFKFRNDTGSKIKIKAQASENDITIKLIKIN